MGKLISTIARDAIDGTEVWKTIAFTVLKCLVHFSSSSLLSQSSNASAARHAIHTSLSRYALLSSFICSLRNSSPVLLGLLESPDGDTHGGSGGDAGLNALYIYEVNMGFLVTVAEGRVRAGMLVVLGQAPWLDARPEGEDSTNSIGDGFLPSAMARYHELLVPALQLVSSIIAILGVSHVQASSR